MIYYAVIDTNVIVASLLSRNVDSATVKVMEAVLDGVIIPLYHRDILREYEEVLSRKKFNFNSRYVKVIIDVIKQYGLEIIPKSTGEILVDMDDLIFYEVTMGKRDDDSYLVTGNQKHYPKKSFIVTPAEMLEIIEGGLAGG